MTKILANFNVIVVTNMKRCSVKLRFIKKQNFGTYTMCKPFYKEEKYFIDWHKKWSPDKKNHTGCVDSWKNILL